MPRTETIGDEKKEFSVTLTGWEVVRLTEMVSKMKFRLEDGNALEKAQDLHAKLKGLVEPTLGV